MTGPIHTRLRYRHGDTPGRSYSADLVYDPAEPVWVRFALHTRCGIRRWLIGRELLRDGLTNGRAGGAGDVEIVAAAGRCLISLQVNGAEAALSFSARLLDAFLARAARVVPDGDEWALAVNAILAQVDMPGDVPPQKDFDEVVDLMLDVCFAERIAGGCAERAA